MRWWAEAYRTANFSLGGPDIREQVGRPRLRLREPPARQGWRLLHARRRRPHHTARRGCEGSPSRWATALIWQWPTSSMADRSLSPRTTVRRIEASVIGRLVNWNPGRSRQPSPGHAPRADREAGLEDEPVSLRSEPRAIPSKATRRLSHPAARSAQPTPRPPASSQHPA